VEVTGRVEVVAFRTVEEFRPFAAERSFGYYVRYEGGPPRIVVPGELGPWQRAMLAHEITHDLLARTYRRQPRWFIEGLAVYMESVDVEEAGARVVVGRPPPLRMERVQKTTVSVAELLYWDGTPGVHPGVDFYASAWVLVHWLVHERPDAFAQLRRHLAEGDDPIQAWREVLPEFDPLVPGATAKLDAVLDHYVQGTLATTTLKGVPMPVVAYAEHPIVPPEVHGVRLALWSFRPEKRESDLRAEVTETLTEDAAHPIALEYLGVLDHLDPAPLARLAVEGHPADPRAYTFLARSLTGLEDGPERMNAYRKALELSPRNPAAYFNVGQELLANGNPGEALPFIRQAVQLAPWSTQVLGGYVAVLAELGQCDEADRVRKSAMDGMPERSTSEERRNVRERLQTLMGSCATVPRPQ
jgi:tetratricopeptide (TPR) repeat protein